MDKTQEIPIPNEIMQQIVNEADTVPPAPRFYSAGWNEAWTCGYQQGATNWYRSLSAQLEEARKERDEFKLAFNHCSEDLRVVRNNGQSYKEWMDLARKEASDYRKALEGLNRVLDQYWNHPIVRSLPDHYINKICDAQKKGLDVMNKYATNNPNT